MSSTSVCRLSYLLFSLFFSCLIVFNLHNGFKKYDIALIIVFAIIIFLLIDYSAKMIFEKNLEKFASSVNENENLSQFVVTPELSRVERFAEGEEASNLATPTEEQSAPAPPPKPTKKAKKGKKKRKIKVKKPTKKEAEQILNSPEVKKNILTPAQIKSPISEETIVKVQPAKPIIPENATKFIYFEGAKPTPPPPPPAPRITQEESRRSSGGVSSSGVSSSGVSDSGRRPRAEDDYNLSAANKIQNKDRNMVAAPCQAPCQQSCQSSCPSSDVSMQRTGGGRQRRYTSNDFDDDVSVGRRRSERPVNVNVSYNNSYPNTYNDFQECGEGGCYGGPYLHGGVPMPSGRPQGMTQGISQGMSQISRGRVQNTIRGEEPSVRRNMNRNMNRRGSPMRRGGSSCNGAANLNQMGQGRGFSYM